MSVHPSCTVEAAAAEKATASLEPDAVSCPKDDGACSPEGSAQASSASTRAAAAPSSSSTVYFGSFWNRIFGPKPAGNSSANVGTNLYVDAKQDQWPIVYSSSYNIGFLGMEKLHPFDSGKWGRVFTMLKEDGMVKADNQVVAPREATDEDLLKIHTQEYLESLKWSYKVAMITEVPPVAILPNFIVRQRLLKPLRLQTGGSILAGKLAMERGWSINIGGGFHHCCAESGGGFCAYADISLCIKFAQERFDHIKKVLIVDLDAHQGNGHEHDVLSARIEDVVVLDVYNKHIYPGDQRAKRGITYNVKLDMYTDDKTYLKLLQKHLPKALDEEKPDLLVYNAGTDVLEGDPLGCLSITPQGVVERDEFVFEQAKSRKIPIVMLTSGGYQRVTARVIADSILNLFNKGIIEPPS